MADNSAEPGDAFQEISNAGHTPEPLPEQNLETLNIVRSFHRREREGERAWRRGEEERRGGERGGEEGMVRVEVVEVRRVTPSFSTTLEEFGFFCPSYAVLVASTLCSGWRTGGWLGREGGGREEC